jgi:hypothetical protein
VRRRKRDLRRSREIVTEAKAESAETLHVVADEALRLAAATDQLREALENSAVPIEEDDLNPDEG